MAEQQRKLRTMPNNIDAEEAVLGSILIDNKAADLIIPMLKAEDFYLEANREIYAVMRALQEASKPVDTVSVADALELAGKLDDVGSVAYLSRLAEGVPSAANSEYYASIIRRDALTRRVIEAGNEIAKFGYQCEDGADALANAEKLVYGIAEANSTRELTPLAEPLGVMIADIGRRQAGIMPENIVYTGYPTLDALTTGFKPGDMILIAARPSVGKTALALNIAVNVSRNKGKSVAIFSLEMPDTQLVKRMLAYVSEVPLSKMDRRGGLSQTESAKLFKAYNSLLNLPIYIDDYSMNSPSDVLSKCRRLKREHGLDLVIIDYLQLMSAGGRNQPESRQQEVSEMTRRMKIYAKELGVPIILLSQMSRAVDQRPDHTPKLSDLRESGAIEQDADMVMFLHKESKYNPAVPENQIKLMLEKNRNGKCDEILLEWEGDTTTFREYADAPSAPAATQTTPPVNAETKAADNGEAAIAKNIVPPDDGLPALKDVAADTMPFPADDTPPWEEASDSDDEYVDDADEGEGDLEY